MTDILPALSRAEKQVLKQYESEVAEGILDVNAGAAKIGKALWDIQDERLYRDTHTGFAEYLADRWDMSKSRGYRLIMIAKESQAHPELPAPTQWALETQTRRSARPNLGTLSGTSLPSITDNREPAEHPVIDAEGEEVEQSAASPPTTDPPCPGGPVPTDVGTINDASANSANDSVTSPPNVEATYPALLPPPTDDTLAAQLAEARSANDHLKAELAARAEADAARVALDRTLKGQLAHLVNHLQDFDPKDAAEASVLAQAELIQDWWRRFTAAWNAAVPLPAKPATVSPIKKAAAKTETPKSTGGCDHPRVSCSPAKEKGKMLCRLCGEVIDVGKMTA